MSPDIAEIKRLFEAAVAEGFVLKGLDAKYVGLTHGRR